MFSLALVQMHVEHGKKLINLDHACEMISEAAKAGARWHKAYICCGLAEKDGGQVYIFAIYRV